MSIFTTIFYQPIFNVLVLLYNLIPGQDLGLAIIAITVIIKIILYPFSHQSLKAQRSLQELQPKIEELKKRYEGKKEELGKAMMELYKNEKVNPLSSCLPLLIQLPFLIAVYQVFRSGLGETDLNLLYPFVNNPGSLNHVSLGFFDLAAPSAVMAVLAGVAQFFTTKMLIATKPPREVRGSAGAKDESMTATMNKQMQYFMPIFTIVIGLSLPAGLTLYWFITTLLTWLQQAIAFRHKKPIPSDQRVIDVAS